MLKWIHRRCAYGTDGLVRPKEYAREVEICYRCGEGLENSVRGPLYLYEVGEEVESIPEPLQGIGEVIEFDPITDEEVIIEDEVQSEDIEPEVEKIRDVETASAQELYEDAVVPIPPENVTATLEEQIAALQAKIDAYEAEKE